MRLARLSAFIVLALPAAAQQPIVVDANGGGDFTSLASAVAAAADGDLILVRAGLYTGGFALDGKGLTIAAEGRVDVEAPGALIEIRNLAAHQSVALHGIRIHAAGGTRVQDCVGAVLFQDCDLGILVPNGGPSGLFVRGSDAVSLVRTTIDLAGQSIDDVFLGGRALRVADSNVFLHDCVLVGSQAPPFPGAGDGWTGNPALHVHGGRVAARGCTVIGGEGGLGNGGCQDGGDGGPAVVLEASTSNGASSELVIIATTLAGGPGAPPTEASCSFGADGPLSIVAPGSSIVIMPVAARSFEADGIVADGGTLTGIVRGPPMDAVALAFSVFAGDPVWTPSLAGAFYIGLPFQAVRIGLIPASGEKIVTAVNPGSGIPWVPLWIQPFHFGPELQLVLSNPRLVVFLDEP